MELVGAEVELLETDETAESGRDSACEIVGVEEEQREACQPAEGGRDGASELLEIAEIKKLEMSKVTDIW